MKQVYIVWQNGVIQSIHRTKRGAQKRLAKIFDGYILTYTTKP